MAPTNTTVSNETKKVDLLTPDAHARRRAMLDAAGKDGTLNRVLQLVDYKVLHTVFEGRKPVDVVTLEAYVAEGLPKTTDRPMQFTAEANKRVANSQYELKLRKEIFHGQTGVDLLAVEQAIYALDKASGTTETELDGDTLVRCGLSEPTGSCVKQFLPRKRVLPAQGTKPTLELGSYSPDVVRGESTPVCPGCRKAIQDAAKKAEGKRAPRFLSKAGCAEAIVRGAQRHADNIRSSEERVQDGARFLTERRGGGRRNDNRDAGFPGKGRRY